VPRSRLGALGPEGALLFRRDCALHNEVFLSEVLDPPVLLLRRARLEHDRPRRLAGDQEHVLGPNAVRRLGHVADRVLARDKGLHLHHEPRGADVWEGDLLREDEHVVEEEAVELLLLPGGQLLGRERVCLEPQARESALLHQVPPRVLAVGERVWLGDDGPVQLRLQLGNAVELLPPVCVLVHRIDQTTELARRRLDVVKVCLVVVRHLDQILGKEARKES